MSEENVELIRRGYELLNRGDMEAAKSLTDANCVIRTRFTTLAGRTYRGHRGIEEWWADVTESWKEMRQTPERLVEADDERIVVIARIEATGRGSGVEIDQEVATIFTVHDAKVTSIESFASVAEALEAAGLSE